MFLRLVAVLLPALALAALQKGPLRRDASDLLEEIEEEEHRLGLAARHLRKQRPASPALLKYEHHLHQQAEAEATDAAELGQQAEETDAAELVDDAMTPPMALPGRHPSVEKALDGMEGDLQNLMEKKLAAKQVRGELEGSVSAAVHHMNDAVSIKHAVREKEAELHREDGKLKVLKWDAGNLDTTRDDLVSSLHRMLGPKVMLARGRLEKREAILQRDSQAAMAWKQKSEQLKASALELIRKKEESHRSVLEAEEEVARAKEKEELARKRYQLDSKLTTEQVQSYRYGETRFKAAVQHEEAAKAAAVAAHESVEKLARVYEVEERKVDESIGYRKNRLEGRMHQIDEARQKSSQELTDLQNQYRDWKVTQRERTAAVVKKAQATAVASDVYASQQKQVLDSAQAKVVRDAEAAGDWDGWGSDMTKAEDEQDD